MTNETTRVAVLGFGTMGAGIAQVCSSAGCEVTVLEANDAAAAAGAARLRTFLEGGVARAKLTKEAAEEVIGRIHPTTDVADLAGVHLVIEAIYEDHEAKVGLLSAVDDVVGADVIIATNTSALSVTGLGASVSFPERFAGLHFFNPAPVMPLVEVVRGIASSEATLQFLVGFAEGLGKIPIVVDDRPGFLVNRLLLPYLNDVIQAYDDGLATAEDLDTALELGLGYPIGPLKLLDLIGLDVHHHATEAAYEASRIATLAPPPLLTRMVEAGFFGTKSGRGFRVDETGGLQ